MRCILLFCLVLSSVAVGSDQAAGRVTAVVGVSEVLRADTRRILQRGDAIFPNDEFETRDAARLVLRMNDGSLITLGGATRMSLQDWRYRPEESDNAGRFRFLEGAFRFITGLITEQDQPQLQVETPAGTIGIRGTDFWGGNLQADVIDVLLLDGHHALVVANEQGQVVIADAGMGTSLRAGSVPAEVVRWSQDKVNRAVATVQLPAKMPEQPE